MALVLREKQVRSLLSMRDTVGVLQNAFNALAQEVALNQPRTRLRFANGTLNILAAVAPTFGVLGCKTYTAFRDGVRFVVLLFSVQNGQLLALIEAEWLNAMRTGGTSALATHYLARQDAAIVGLIGAGQQAVTQLMGMCAVRPISAAYVYSRRPQERDLFCREMTRLLKIDVRPVPLAKRAVEVADILITATTATEPVVQGEWIKPGCHINAIGSVWSHRRELDCATLQRCALIVTDSREQATAEAGDFIIPANEGSFQWTRVRELTEIVSKPLPPPRTPQDITLYKGVGIALADIVTAAHVYNLACEEGIGEEIALLS
jgi:alanine dehydrogenase